MEHAKVTKLGIKGTMFVEPSAIGCNYGNLHSNICSGDIFPYSAIQDKKNVYTNRVLNDIYTILSNQNQKGVYNVGFDLLVIIQVVVNNGCNQVNGTLFQTHFFQQQCHLLEWGI